MLRPLIAITLSLALLSGCGGGSSVHRTPEKSDRALSEWITDYGERDYISVVDTSGEDNLSQSEQALNDFLRLSAQLRLEPLLVTESLFAAINPELLPPQQQLEYQLDYARFLTTADTDKALQQLNHPAVSIYTLEDHPELFASFYQLRAEIHVQMGFNAKAANDYIKREQFIFDEAPISANQSIIWGLLSHLSQEQLDGIILGEAGSTLQGWADLAAIARELTRFPDELSEQIALWQGRYYGHPAQETFITELLERSHKLVIKPKQIAVLLPLSGSYAKAAAALRDGILTSYLADLHKDEIALRFYDTAGDPDSLDEIFQQMVNDEIGFILGPLNKEVVQRLISMNNGYPYSIPSLTLNLIKGVTRENIYQFSLSPEDEAINAANRAWHEGHSRVSMLLPESTLGKRISLAFRKQWAAYGGTITSSAYYNPKLNDFATPIKSLLNINHSETRRKTLRRIIGEKFEFTPRRREDIDLIFLSAQPRQARIIKPQLRFHHALDIPVIASSHLYTGKPNQQVDRDMNGILFGDMPWNIRQTEFAKTNVHLHKKYSGQLKRLVAMGIDSYQIIPLLPLLDAYPDEIYQGESGQLSLNKSNQIERKLAWSQFRRGVPKEVKDFIYIQPGTDKASHEYANP